MRIINEKPPIYDRIIAAGMKPNERTIFAYGDAIYNPNNLNIPDYLIEHESTHCEQQGDNPDGWWDRYISDQYFRVQEEADAYARQYAFLCGKIKDRNQRTRILYEISGILAGPIYGNVITTNAAMDMIKKKSKVK